MIQDVLTYMLIASATGYILFSLYRMIVPSKKLQSMGCPGCSGCDAKTDAFEAKLQTSPGVRTSPGVNASPGFNTSSGVKISLLRSYSSDSGSETDGGANTVWVPQDFASSDLANRLQ